MSNPDVENANFEYAIRAGHLEFLKELLSSGSNPDRLLEVNYEDFPDKPWITPGTLLTPVHYCILQSTEHSKFIELIDLLLKYHCELNEVSHAMNNTSKQLPFTLSDALEKDWAFYKNMFAKLIEHGLDLFREDETGGHLFHYISLKKNPISKRKNHERVAWIYSIPGVSEQAVKHINQINENGFTAIDLLLRNKNGPFPVEMPSLMLMLQMHLDNGADPDLIMTGVYREYEHEHSARIPIIQAMVISHQLNGERNSPTRPTRGL